MQNNIFDAKKFSWTEIFSNDNGRTSSSKVIGVASTMVCVVLFFVLIVFYMCNVAEGAMIIEMIDRIISFFGISTALMGVKSVTASFGKNKMHMDNTEDAKPKKKGPNHLNEMENCGDMQG